jgi:hypothetical protein
MVQFNLLPDVKLQYIKAKRLKRTVAVISFLVSGALLAIFIILLLYVRVAQKQHMNALTEDINASVATLQETPDLDKILTIQNQLNSLPGLHEEKTISSRLVDYLSKLTPAKATISSAEVNMEENTMILQGNANALSTVNKFIDTIKFTKYRVNVDEADAEAQEAFSDVVLENFSVSTSPEAVSGEAAVTYEITLNFESDIFAYVREKADQSKPDIIMNIPRIISTRSEVESPDELFVPQPDIEETEEQQ